MNTKIILEEKINEVLLRKNIMNTHRNNYIEKLNMQTIVINLTCFMSNKQRKIEYEK